MSDQASYVSAQACRTSTCIVPPGRFQLEKLEEKKGGRMTHRHETAKSLRRLGDADYEVAPGARDVRGWRVIAANDQTVGRVEDFVIDPAAEKVRYLEVDIDREVARLDRDR